MNEEGPRRMEIWVNGEIIDAIMEPAAVDAFERLLQRLDGQLAEAMNRIGATRNRIMDLIIVCDLKGLDGIAQELTNIWRGLLDNDDDQEVWK
jgi:hypothetical protein